MKAKKVVAKTKEITNTQIYNVLIKEFDRVEKRLATRMDKYYFKLEADIDHLAQITANRFRLLDTKFDEIKNEMKDGFAATRQEALKIRDEYVPNYKFDEFIAKLK